MPQKYDEKSVTLLMEKSNSAKDSNDEKLVGPLLDYAAPYSGIGFQELRTLSPYLTTN